MKRIILILFIVLASSMKNYSLSLYQEKKDKTGDKVLKKVSELPEVKEWLKMNVKGQKTGLLLNQPDKDEKYYRVQVGLDDLDMFRTNYYLVIYPKTFQIYFGDVLDTANSNITLQQWRYWRTKPGWNKMHYYKAGKLVVLEK